MLLPDKIEPVYCDHCGSGDVTLDYSSVVSHGDSYSAIIDCPEHGKHTIYRERMPGIMPPNEGLIDQKPGCILNVKNYPQD